MASSISGGGREATEHPTAHRAAPQTRNNLVHNVSPAQAEKPRCGFQVLTSFPLYRSLQQCFHGIRKHALDQDVPANPTVGRLVARLGLEAVRTPCSSHLICWDGKYKLQKATARLRHHTIQTQAQTESQNVTTSPQAPRITHRAQPSHGLVTGLSSSFLLFPL